MTKMVKSRLKIWMGL